MTASRKPFSGSSRSRPPEELLTWHGRLPWFASMREGGPGRPLSLAVNAALAASLLLVGIDQTDKGGAAGPALILLAIAWLGFLVLWLLIKGVLRGREVTFVLDEKGVRVLPSPAQRNLDRRMSWLVRMVFLFTWKGGQWAHWQPVTRWKEIRAVEFDDLFHRILIRGGAWDIRLLCEAERYPDVRALIESRLPARTRIRTTSLGELS